MDSTLVSFVRALRSAGAEPSTSETIDAARAVALVGYGDRAELKAALGMALAKSDEEKRIHDKVFDLYFTPLSQARPQAPTNLEYTKRLTERGLTGSTEIDLLLNLATNALSDAADPDGATSGHDLRMALTRAADAVEVNNIRFDTQSAWFERRMLDHLGIAALESRLAQQIGNDSPESQAEVRALTEARHLLQREARAVVQHRFELFGEPATEAFMTEVAVNRPLGRMAPAEMQRIKIAVARMAKKLASRQTRRQRQKLRGQLDIRRTMRANAGHDGTPFRLAFKHRRRHKPRIVAICDMSRSVASQAPFLLMFLYALHEAVDDLRTFAFSNKLKDVSALLETQSLDEAMALILKLVGNGATDCGQVWLDLHDRHWDPIDRRTTVIVLGDGRSNGADPRLDLFAALAGLAKRVVWLCPEPQGRWGSGDSDMLRYRPFCTSLSHCATALDLEHALDETFESYR
jgi:uncharacterized protein with von Willebrand factor type A (vWA) domain